MVVPVINVIDHDTLEFMKGDGTPKIGDVSWGLIFTWRSMQTPDRVAWMKNRTIPIKYVSLTHQYSFGMILHLWDWRENTEPINNTTAVPRQIYYNVTPDHIIRVSYFFAISICAPRRHNHVNIFSILRGRFKTHPPVTRRSPGRLSFVWSRSNKDNHP